jgi:hypothetical protein
MQELGQTMDSAAIDSNMIPRYLLYRPNCPIVLALTMYSLQEKKLKA